MANGILYHWVTNAISISLLVYRLSINSNLVSQHSKVAVLLILVLHELAQVTERLGALRALVWHVGHTAASASVGQHWSAGQVRTHAALGLCEVVYLPPCVVTASATSAVAALHVLNSVCARPESPLTADLFAQLSNVSL